MMETDLGRRAEVLGAQIRSIYKTQAAFARAAKLSQSKVSRAISPKATSEELQREVETKLRDLQESGASPAMNGVDDPELAKRKADARRNAGIVVRDTNSGSVWFRIPFPDYMVVETPMTVRIEADANDPDFEKLRKHFAGSEP